MSSFLLIVLVSFLVCAGGATNQQPIVIELEASARADTTPTASSTTTKPTNITSSPSYATCGVANFISNDEIRIVGGEQTLPNEFPWQAYLNVEMTNNKVYYCGGTLIADRWILTAASCLVVPGQNLKSVAVYLGAHNILATSEVNRRLYYGTEVYIHANYNAATLAGDIALIKLSTTVTYTQYIRPVCLATATEPNYANSQVTVTGWGSTYDGSTGLSPLLRKVTVPVITNSECSSTYGSIVTDKIVCTSGAGSRGICNGDGGGPINFKQTKGNWKQIGIASFTSATGCQSSKPSGYTRLSSYSTWVQSVMSSNNVPTTTTTKPPTTDVLPTTKETTRTRLTSRTTTLPSTSSTTAKPSLANSSFAFLSSALIAISFLINTLQM